MFKVKKKLIPTIFSEILPINSVFRLITGDICYFLVFKKVSNNKNRGIILRIFLSIKLRIRKFIKFLNKKRVAQMNNSFVTGG